MQCGKPHSIIYIFFKRGRTICPTFFHPWKLCALIPNGNEYLTRLFFSSVFHPNFATSLIFLGNASISLKKFHHPFSSYLLQLSHSIWKTMPILFPITSKKTQITQIPQNNKKPKLFFVLNETFDSL